ncbi:hypothetical protein CDAR_122911 [Caerostris darwini]|uniref:Uncharacterized protein n=1 Tax=Caerostris darwini TaxID=1538125 RepID=A0AAV4PQV1_9ARAC|nr:hypothetical protein CDAR_122911 [Caerostris darwini]
MSLPETLLRAPAGRNVQNQLARLNVGDGSHEPSSFNMHRPRTGNVMLNEPVCFVIYQDLEIPSAPIWVRKERTKCCIVLQSYRATICWIFLVAANFK